MRRGLLLVVLAALLVAATPGPASASTCRPLNDGGQWFPPIDGPEDPEDYCYEVSLGEEQELRQIDDRHVGVFYNTGQQSSVFTAEEAADVEGASVPTTLSFTAMNEITLTVHHRDGNPRAGGAPFHYPITAGPGWEGGFHTTLVPMSPAAETPSPDEESPAPLCEVPVLQDRSLRDARHVLERAHCRLGPVHGKRSRGAKVVKQYRPVGKTLPAGSTVGVKLGR